MKNIILLSGLLLIGLTISQFLPSLIPSNNYNDSIHYIRILTSLALAFIMIRVGYEFKFHKNTLSEYGWDYLVAAGSATFSWIFVALYFIFVLSDTATVTVWKESLLASRFAAPTSAGILFSMLAAAGLASTWMYEKVKILAIFDDLDTVLLLIPLKIFLVGWAWQLGIGVLPMFLLLWVAWRYLHQLHIPITWPWVISYAIIIVLASEGIHRFSMLIDNSIPIHCEVLLPAFVLGCMIVKENNNHVIERPTEKRVTLLISAIFMVLVGLSMPSIINIADLKDSLTPSLEQTLDWGWIFVHVILVTFVSNIGKLFPLFFYRKEAHWKERLALSISMFPRGEVGAGVLILSISYGIGGPMVMVAMLSLTLNLLLTGVFIIIVKKLLNGAGVKGTPKLV